MHSPRRPVSSVLASGVLLIASAGVVIGCVDARPLPERGPSVGSDNGLSGGGAHDPWSQRIPADAGTLAWRAGDGASGAGDRHDAAAEPAPGPARVADGGAGADSGGVFRDPGDGPDGGEPSEDSGLGAGDRSNDSGSPAAVFGADGGGDEPAGHDLAPFGEPCSEPGDCASGFCLDPGLCARTCGAFDGCPVGWACRDWAPAGADAVRICVPTMAGLCRSCGSDADCRRYPGNEAASRCLADSLGASRCSLACAADRDCPTGTVCQVLSPEHALCLPDSGCPPPDPPEPDEVGVCRPDVREPCGQGAGRGSCRLGERVCQPGGVWGLCVGAVGPSPEECNGLDDDCDGETDEQVAGAGVSCGQVEGECFAGRLECTGGELLCLGARDPLPETCNGLDDDCDGATDEDPAGAGDPCGRSEGTCVPGRLTCLDGWLQCVGEVTARFEVCNGVDDDCDGRTDEDAADVGAPCGVEQGECRPGRSVCEAGGLLCAGAVGPQPEACNGLDDDCDGDTDEGLRCGSSVRVRAELPVGARAGELAVDVGAPEGPLVAGPGAGVLELEVDGVPAGRHSVQTHFVDADGLARLGCELVGVGSPRLTQPVPLVWIDGIPATVALGRDPDGGCSFRFEVGPHPRDPLWSEGPHRLGLSGTLLDSPCAVVVGGFHGWWSGPIARRGPDQDLHVDFSSVGGLPAGSWSLHLWGLSECPPPQAAAHVLIDDIDQEATIERDHECWRVLLASFGPLASGWLQPFVHQGQPTHVVAVFVDAQGSLLPGGTLAADGLPDPGVAAAQRCLEGDTAPCGSVAGEPAMSTCLDGAWHRCTPQSEGWPAEVSADGLDNDGDGFVDEDDPGNLVSNPSFEQGPAAWLPSDNLPLWGRPDSDGAGNAGFASGSAAQGQVAGRLQVQHPNTLPPAEDWHLQLQAPVAVQAGVVYQLLFRARADAPRRLAVELSDPAHDYRSVGTYVGSPDQYLHVGPTWVTYRLPVLPLRDCADARLAFSSGAEAGLLLIDDVSLVPLER